MYLDRFKLDDKIAVVTGAARGIGLATSEALVEAGATVILTDMNADALNTAVAALSAKGLSVEGELLEVTDPEAVQRSVHDVIVARHGRVDVLVNNAGIAISNHPAETMSDEVWKKVIDVNLNGVFWCCPFGKGIYRSRRRQHCQCRFDVRFHHQPPAGTVELQRLQSGGPPPDPIIGRRVGRPWCARTVAPTYIDTEMNGRRSQRPQMYRHWVGGTPMNRLGRVDEVASVILFSSASDAASLMTGSIVLADGGHNLLVAGPP